MQAHSLTSTTRGSLLFELLLSLGLFAIVLSPLLGSIRALTHEALRYQQRSEALLTITRIRSLITENARTAQTRLGFQAIRIQSPTRTLQTLIPNTNTLRVKPDSHGISFLHLAHESELEIISNKPFAEEATRVTVCAKGIEDDTRHYLAVGVDGYRMVHAAGTKREHIESRCSGNRAYELSVNVLPKDPFSQVTRHARILENLSRLIPIRRAFSLYLASNNSLRYFSHTRYENQPLAYGVTEFKVIEHNDSYRAISVRLDAGNKKPAIFHLPVEQSTSHSYLNHVV